MKFLKALLLIIVLLVGVYLVMCALGPSSFDTEQSIVIDASPEMVFEEIEDYKQWTAWSPWEGMDPSMKTSYSGADSGMGAVTSWTSDSGNGRMEVIEVVDNQTIKNSLAFTDADGNSMGEGTANFYLEEVEGGTKVTWDMVGFDLPFMIRGMMLAMGGSVEEDYKKGLASLKEVVEAKPSFEPMSETMPDMWVISVQRDNVTMDQLAGGAVHGPAYGMIMEFMGAEGLQPAGMPISISRRYSEESMELSMSIPVADSVGVPEGMICEIIPGGKVMYAIHKGPYDGVGETWMKLENYFEKNPMEIRYYPFEIYTNDPATVAEDEIETKIVYPVAG